MGSVGKGLVCALAASVSLAACREEAGGPPEPPLTEGCRTCHGSNANAAPPRALDGREDTSALAVGAHQAHLLGSHLGRGVSCKECHLVPEHPDNPGHTDTPLPAELSFGPLALNGALAPAWDRESATCSNTYCHGATLTGGDHTRPMWTVVDGTQSRCGACHGMPPPPPHAASDACETCHSPVVGPGGVLTIPTRHADGVLDVADKCGTCHGSSAGPAPPKDLAGMSDETRVTVGAHRTHLAGGFHSRPVSCAECHLVPREVEEPGHVDSDAPAELTFGAIATTDGSTPTWSRDQASCASTYCHGGAAPRWTLTDGTQAPCGSCHGLPPPAPHPLDDRCETCHLPTAGPGKTIANRNTHVDGVLQVALEGCNGCHGNSENLAPPMDMAQRADTTLRSVGAHQAHLTGGRASRPVGCDTCHLVPATVDDPGHRDTDLPAELRFDGLAIAHGATPSWSSDQGSCASTYCHGATLEGGTHPVPVWTNAGGNEATCGACHGLPPPAPHPANDRCALCHAPTAGPALTIANRATHLDGVVQTTSGDCTACHGDASSSAPPKDSTGGVDPLLLSVGAHRAHDTVPSGLSRPVACSECHVVPAALNVPGHVDTALPAELTFGPLATAQGAPPPSFDEASGTCANVYCHGATLRDGAVQAPRWTTTDGSPADCGACHGAPPGGSHPQDQACERCHTPTAGPNRTIADSSTHIDGVLQAASGCDACHGENGVSAPPRDLDGMSLTTLLSVGAHRVHLDGGLASKPVSCGECHVVPATPESPGHNDTPRPAELVFGSIAGLRHVPRWTSPTCANTYCHDQGGAATNPVWNRVDGSQGRCDSCHGNPPVTPVHQAGGDCATCHLPTAGPGDTIADRTTHVDGVVQVADVACNTCHGGPAGAAPPQDISGATAPTDPEVGAHEAHLNGGRWSRPLSCDACHVVPLTQGEPGHIDATPGAELNFSGLASAQRTVPFWDPVNRTCASSYCHGGATTLAAEPLPVWNQPGSVPCGGCHGLPPAAPHPQVDRCELCHAPVAGPNHTIAAPARHVDGIEDVQVPNTCQSCHGTAASPAPPIDLDGASASGHVGAHQAHLQGTGRSRPVLCAECHVPVSAVDLAAPGHFDSARPAELTFGPLARHDGQSPSANGATCRNTYCHGSTLPGGSATAPAWSAGPQPCGACHGMPPPDASHGGVGANDCNRCHPTAGANQTITLAARHVDGVVDVTSSCGTCHGTSSNTAPPLDMAGQSDTALITVGAHQAHLSGGYLSKPVACAECHLVPAAVDSPGHRDTPGPAELTFGTVARSGGANPAWNRGSATCSNTYCHGPAAPEWTRADGTQAACGSCHALPPPAPHPVNDRCELCHLPTAGPGQTIADRNTHLDGLLQVAIDGCTGCHGSGNNLAPPSDTLSRADTSLRSVGAHQAHLSGGTGSRPVACDTCHVVPSTVDAPGHRDTATPAEVRFTHLATSGGLSPSYQAAQGTCANTYCHGSTLAGGTNLTPLWTAASGSEAACGSCHGLPPPAPHPAIANCALCHAPTAGPGLTIANRATHVDGVVQAATGDCLSCHGGGTSSAPPFDTTGGFDPALITVGAHRAHVEGASGLARPVACSECHVVPAAVDSPGHVDTAPPAELTFGPLATARGAVHPTFDAASGTCGNTYCHGSTLDDGAVQSPVWTITDGSQSACGACHGLPPAGAHPADDRCELCHAPTAGPGQTIADPTSHIDGVLQAAGGCDSCHGESGQSAPPRDLDGLSLTSLVTVGAHRTHLAGGNASRPVACSECHLVPAATNSPGHVDTPRPAEIVFGPTAGLGSSPLWTTPTCQNTYCHAQGGAAPSPTWTLLGGAQSRCDSCHGDPPATPVHQAGGACATCHLPTAGPGDTIADRGTHVDGVLQVSDLNCNTCHGNMNGNAPPMDLAGGTASSDPQVGTHQAHLLGGQWSRPVACDACHVVPATTNAPGHLDANLPSEVRFSGLAAAQLSTPVYGGGGTCADSYCHGATSSLGTNANPTWNQAGSVPCDGCHGLPPAAPHPQLDRCEVCHAAVAGPNLTITNRARHLDGVEDVSVPGTCQTCHGTAADPAPPLDLAGLMSSAAVGAHRPHLQGTGRARAVPCVECHLPVAPGNVGAPGHYDTAPPAEVSFGALARQGGLNAARSGATCNNTYCHGAALPGAATPSPTWTQGALACNACHGMPPPDGDHTGVTANQCASCHPDTAGANQSIVNPARHVDGVVDTSASCDACHGQNGDPTPPRDLAGRQNGLQIGAHQAHRAPQRSAPVACNTCHLVPATYSSAGHADTAAPAEVILAGRAALGGVTPSYAGGQFRCNNTYCHGATLTGGKTQVTWTDADGSESLCGACHGMPPATPAHNGQSATGCNSCHMETAGPNATIIAPALHLDGVVQVSGGGCDTCHGAPPAPGRESYAGSAGAHATHAGTLGFECAACHGNNGAGPQHNQGSGTVVRANVNLVFTARTFPGGTTMNNGGTASYNTANRTCQVGCHNPIVGNPAEAPALTNRPSWAATPVSCVGCHDSVQTAPPRNHDLTALGDAGCLECHDQASHMVQLTIRDPDPTDSYVWTAAQPDGLCRTCHDSGTTRAFGNQAPRNVMTAFAASAHAARGQRCTTCHAVHASTGGPLFVDPASATCMASGCHNNLTDFSQAPGGVNSHHRIEGGTGIQLSCSSCHNAHVSRAAPEAAVDPDNRWAIYSIPATATTQRRSSGDYRAFCLRCHDGTPPAGVQGALNIATALSNSRDPSGFRRSATESLHKESHGGFNCQNCHEDHGSNGTLGIQRGRMLRNYMTINNFNATARTYAGENSCSTPRTIPGFGFGCH